MIEITTLCKSGGALTKRISLTAAGTLRSDGSCCIMSSGTANRAVFNDLHDFAEFITGLDSTQAIALGTLLPSLPDQVEVATKARLESMNGTAQPNMIARTSTYITYRPNQPALALIDIDVKHMPASVDARIRDLGGFWRALIHAVPELAQTARVVRASTSSGITRADTGETLVGSGGYHVYLLVADGGDAPRFLRALHDNCWLHGLAWMAVGAGGQLLDRSIIDRMVGAPERLAFEGAPVLNSPLAQDTTARRATAHAGAALDTLTACPPLSIAEQVKIAEAKARAAYELAPAVAEARAKFIGDQAARIVKRRSGCTMAAARRTAERQCCDGVLLPDIVLPFDATELEGCTVGDVLADPRRFDGATLADPLEGVDYGRCCAKIMIRSDGTPWINSFAHGRAVYELKHGATSIETILAATADAELVARFAVLVVGGDVDDPERERLRDIVHKRTGTGKRTIDRTIAAERAKQAGHAAQEAAQQRAAERRDPRPQIPAPAPDAPWLPQMAVPNDVLGSSTAPEPPTRNIDAQSARLKLRAVPLLRLLSTDTNNAEQEIDQSPLPAPEQLCLVRMDEIEVSEMIERHIDYADKKGRSVHLPMQFVRHFMKRDDGALPTVVAISQLPIVLADGAILTMRGLDRDRGIIFRIPEELMKVLPKPEDCTPAKVAEAMQFLCDEWLCDVSTDYIGKCTLIADALTMVERSLLPDRPVFFITAGRRGGGKTTTLHMLVMAVFGVRAAAAAWSPNEEERRKAVLSYFMEALPFLIWDNIPRGTQITCPHIERSCTTALYTDRKLGVSEMVATSASTIHHFTGNNIGPKGDLASRALSVRLEVDRADPENRQFRHNDPIGWTEAHRGQIMASLYTVLLGNPFLRTPMGTEAKTRFKVWWRLIGSAVENAAAQHDAAAFPGDAIWNQDCPPKKINFKDLFLAQEEDDEESASLADALVGMAGRKWPGDSATTFQAADIAKLVNDRSEYVADADVQLSATLREFLFPNTPPGHVATAKAVGKRLGRHLGEPVRKGDQTLILRKHTDPHTKGLSYYVECR